jgi:hypothetical protein
MYSLLLAGLAFALVIVPPSRSVRVNPILYLNSLTCTVEGNTDFLAAVKTWCYEIQALRAFMWMDWAIRESLWYTLSSD